MEAMRILEAADALRWKYDEEADVLYISIGEPRPAVTVDLGVGVLARYNEAKKELVGITLVGMRARLLEGLSARETA